MITDLDGTLIKGDSLRLFLRFSSGSQWGFLLRSVLSIPILILWKLGLVKTESAKGRLIYNFVGSIENNDFEQLGMDFSQRVLIPRIREFIKEKIETANASGGLSLIVSASPEQWVKPIAESLNALAISTRLSFNSGRFEGKISGKNCKGVEKIHRIEQEVDISQFKEIWVFGNSQGDLPMMQIGTRTWYKRFS